jgi:hypothetical protein
MTTDCGCISAMRSWDDFNDPMVGIICLPVMIFSHLIDLPIACCSPNENGCYGTGNLEQQKQHDKELRLQLFEETKKEKKKIERKNEEIDIKYKKRYLALDIDEPGELVDK